MWKDKWVRGVISMEDQFLIWLVDYGLYLRPTEKTVYTKLPLEYKRYPSKVFEASIHGVVPITQVCWTMSKILFKYLFTRCKMTDVSMLCWSSSSQHMT